MKETDLKRLDYLTGLKNKTEEEYQEHIELLEKAFCEPDVFMHLEFDENYKLITKNTSSPQS